MVHYFLVVENLILSCILAIKVELNHRSENNSLKCLEFMTYNRKILLQAYLRDIRCNDWLVHNTFLQFKRKEKTRTFLCRLFF